MKTSKLWLPILLGVAVISLTSQFGSVPAAPAWLPSNAELDTIAHLLLYLLLGFLIARYISLTSQAGTVAVLVVSAALCTLVGALDEVHQTYIPGRSAELRDVLADLSGGLAGAAGYLLLASLGQLIGKSVLVQVDGFMNRAGRLAAVVIVAVALVVPAVLYGPMVVPVAGATLEYAKACSKEAIAGAFGLEVPKAVSQPQGGTRVTASRATNGPGVTAVQPQSQSSQVNRRTLKITDLDEETRRELIRDLTNQITRELAGNTGKILSLNQSQTVAAAAQLASAGELSVADHLSAQIEPNARRPRVVKTVYHGPQMSDLAQIRDAARVRSTELVAVIVHPENPVSELSLNDVRRLLAGDYGNWTRVGGDDTAVQVITGQDSAASLQDLLKVAVDPRAARLYYSSLMIPAVAQSRGNIGFMVVKTIEQLALIVGQENVKVVPIKYESASGAVALSRSSLFGGTYPLTRDYLVSHPWTADSAGSGQQIVLNARQ